MPKETKKTAAKAPAKEEVKKKNPLLDADEDTSEESEEGTDETTEEEAEESAESEEAEAEEEEAPAPKKPAKAAKAPAAAETVGRGDIGAALNSDIRTTKAALEAEEKVHFMVPLSEGEKPGATHDCFINGYKYTVKKGTMTIVPRSIADLLANHYKVTSEAGADYRLDLHPDKDAAQAN